MRELLFRAVKSTPIVLLLFSSALVLGNIGVAAETEPAAPVAESAAQPTATEPDTDAASSPTAASQGGGYAATSGTAGSDFKFTISGYLREHVSINLQDHPETKPDDTFTLQMARSTLQVEATAGKDDVIFHAVGRVVGEIKTDYLRRLEAIGANSGADLMDRYNKSDLRELYVDLHPFERLTLRLGKQQVVWGESDFFQAMDVVHGFDYSWRLFLEGENEDYRKPLVLANATIQVPEANGSLQLIFRPGLDRDQDIGSTYDLFGGRWAVQPFKGVNFLPLFPYNLHHPKGDASKPTGGARWLGKIGPITYSFAYLRTLGPDPLFNSVFAPYDGIAPSKGGMLGETIYLVNDRYGLTMSGYSSLADAVFSMEVAYIKGQGYNVGTHFAPVPGLNGIITKNTISAMARMDKRLNLTSILGTNEPSFFTVQVFDKWIQDYRTSDDIVDLAGFQAAKKEHSVIGTVVLGLNYMASRVNPQIAAGYDFSYGGGFLIPSVALAFGDKWRLLTEADLFLPHHANSTATTFTGESSENTHLMGYLAHNNQLSIRLTRQF